MSLRDSINDAIDHFRERHSLYVERKIIELLPEWDIDPTNPETYEGRCQFVTGPDFKRPGYYIDGTLVLEYKYEGEKFVITTHRKPETNEID